MIRIQRKHWAAPAFPKGKTFRRLGGQLRMRLIYDRRHSGSGFDAYWLRLENPKVPKAKRAVETCRILEDKSGKWALDTSVPCPVPTLVMHEVTKLIGELDAATRAELAPEVTSGKRGVWYTEDRKSLYYSIPEIERVFADTAARDHVLVNSDTGERIVASVKRSGRVEVRRANGKKKAPKKKRARKPKRVTADDVQIAYEKAQRASRRAENAWYRWSRGKYPKKLSHAEARQKAEQADERAKVAWAKHIELENKLKLQDVADVAELEEKAPSAAPKKPSKPKRPKKAEPKRPAAVILDQDTGQLALFGQLEMF